MLGQEDHTKPDTHSVPLGNYMIGLGNYVSVNRSDLGNFLIAHTLLRKKARSYIGDVAKPHCRKGFMVELS